MCGGFTCSKNALTALNVLYILVAFILIFAATIGKVSAYVTSETVIGGIVACGVFLLLVSILGLIGAVKHHQVMLFFYMVILFLLFIVQFSVAIACLAVTDKQQVELLQNTWDRAGNETKDSIQHMFHCCSFDDFRSEHPPCEKIPTCCPGYEPDSPTPQTCCSSKDDCKCETCRKTLVPNLSYAYKVSGILGLVFSFTEFVGVWLTMRYRNQKDPRANAAAFLYSDSL